MVYRLRRVVLAGTRLLSFGANGTGARVPVRQNFLLHPGTIGKRYLRRPDLTLEK
jgi:hypothetical protein